MRHWFVLWAALCSVSALADIHIPKTTATITIDGDLSDAGWEDANKVQIEINSWPSENTPAPVATQVLLMENGEYFYLAFKAKDSNPSQIRAFLKDRDDVWEDDLVGVKIDSYNDQKLAYQFFSNPLGVQADAIENEVTGDESDAWDGIWQSVGTLTPDGYQVEIAIPLRILNFNDRLALQQWRIELVRFYPRDLKHRLSSNKIERTNPCWICQMRVATGFSGAKQGSHFSVVPSLVTGVSQEREVTNDTKTAWQSEANTEVSLDLKWGITPDINLNATLNPDFSQVEADVAQVSMNDTFSLFFDEKRAFFLDNKDYFSSPLDLVYTRNIGAPDLGAKLTGKQQQHSFAFFAANDAKTTFIVPGNLGSDVAVLDEESTNAVFRYRYDLNADLSLGWISSLRQSDSYHNHLAGVDLKYKVTEQDELVLQYLYTDSAYSEPLRQSFGDSEAALRLADNLSDPAYFLMYEHDDGAWLWNTEYLALEKDFRADMGYMPQTDFTKFVQGLGYQWFSNNKWWNRAILSGDWDISHNANHELLEKEAELFLELWGPQQSFVSFSLTDRDKVGPRLNNNSLAIDGNTLMFHEKRFITFAEFRPLPALYANAEIELGDAIDYRNNRLGELVQFTPELSWNASTHLQIEARQTYRYLEADGAEVFTANLTDLRFSYQFSVRSLLRLTLIYSDIRQNPLNNPGLEQQLERSLGSQLLYSYKLNPQTLFFAGYSDNAYQNDELTSMERDQRSVFMKFSYAWLL
ncbi:carbohydrate binding family 9 domain-containing protein [Rheinheimera sp.]|uniref:carbohydrate binding family 9 domain-containing protein n=1 Tax=Rheinheimera sp. TaxID=1869214 RepID=UPI00262F9E5B|nr:DUF5916 domain-containing protein [Rheinheimera sp.]MCA1930551.1 carbohydrate binding family 9 domain-containing protein [Rheinheimera sp.]